MQNADTEEPVTAKGPLVDTHQNKAASDTEPAPQSENIQNPVEGDDINPRSPKRRRTSPADNDTEIDFEAAAARALAISLGVNHPSVSPIPVTSQSQQNGLSQTASIQSTGRSVSSDQQARIAGLSTVDELANQILTTLARMTHLEIGEMLFGPASQRGQDYRALKTQFEQAKKIYLTNSPFISPSAVGFQGAEQIDVLRKTNMATFMTSIFSGEIGLRIMDINFLDVFVPEGGRLLKAQASIYLELKTQAFIAAKRTAPAILNQVILDLFPTNVEKDLLARRPGAKSLAPSEIDFQKRVASRREILYADMRNDRLENLHLRYRWDDFSREVNSYLSKTFDQTGNGNKPTEQISPVPARMQLQQGQMESQFPLASHQTQQSNTKPASSNTGSDLGFNLDDFMAQAARAAEIALQGTGHTSYVPTPSNNQVALQTVSSTTPVSSTATQPVTDGPPVQQPSTQTLPLAQPKIKDNTQAKRTEFQQYKPAQADPPLTVEQSEAEEAEDGIPHKSQTAPTQVLYERARMVTTNKASPSSRKPNPPSHRRPWTREEEHALMTGLDQVKGPHWSQILAMYGPGGTINESLKDRNQVQLKDKARNLKLFFLKAGIEVPYYLQAVTGDLKTRAPAQAEKREARERERMNTEEDDMTALQDESELDLVDDSELPALGVADHEDDQDATSMKQNGQKDDKHKGQEVGARGKNDTFDLEAAIARATASATQSMAYP